MPMIEAELMENASLFNLTSLIVETFASFFLHPENRNNRIRIEEVSFNALFMISKI
jgi:hypothetical protein